VTWGQFWQEFRSFVAQELLVLAVRIAPQPERVELAALILPHLEKYTAAKKP